MVTPAADALRLPAQPMILMKYCQMMSQSKLLYLGRIVGIRMGPQPKSLGAARFAFIPYLVPQRLLVDVSFLSAKLTTFGRNMRASCWSLVVSVHVPLWRRRERWQCNVSTLKDQLALALVQRGPSTFAHAPNMLKNVVPFIQTS